MVSIKQSRWTLIGISIFLIAITWAVFGQTVRHQFVNYDDPLYVLDNAHVRAGLTWRGIAWAFTHVHSQNWHPLTTMSHMFDCQLFGVNPGAHHLVNVFFHSIAAVLLFILLAQITNSIWASAFVAALFAIHPLRVESVAWVAERKDVLSGVFFMLTLWAYARYARSDRFSWGRYTKVLVLFALGLMCKPTLVTLPFVLLLLDYWPLGRVQNSDFRGQRSAVAAPVRGAPQRRTAGWLHLIVEKIPLFVLSAASCVATILAQK